MKHVFGSNESSVEFLLNVAPLQSGCQAYHMSNHKKLFSFSELLLRLTILSNVAQSFLCH